MNLHHKLQITTKKYLYKSTLLIRTNNRFNDVSNNIYINISILLLLVIINHSICTQTYYRVGLPITMIYSRGAHLSTKF